MPVNQTQSTIPQDLLQDVMRRPYRERLRLIINELGTGLAGRPQDLNAVIHRADPALQQTSRVLKILGNQNKVIQNFIVNSDTVMTQLAARKHDVARFIVEAGKTSSITASREQAFQAQWHKLPAFLAAHGLGGEPAAQHGDQNWLISTGCKMLAAVSSLNCGGGRGVAALRRRLTRWSLSANHNLHHRCG